MSCAPPPFAGKAQCVGRRLQRIDLRDFSGNLDAYARPEQLLVVLCTRADVPVCRRAEKLCEAMLEYLEEEEPDPDAAKAGKTAPMRDSLRGTALSKIDGSGVKLLKGNCKVYKVEMTESRAFIRHYNVLTLPQYLMFFGGQLVYR